MNKYIKLIVAIIFLMNIVYPASADLLRPAMIMDDPARDTRVLIIAINVKLKDFFDKLSFLISDTNSSKIRLNVTLYYNKLIKGVQFYGGSTTYGHTEFEERYTIHSLKLEIGQNFKENDLIVYLKDYLRELGLTINKEKWPSLKGWNFKNITISNKTKWGIFKRSACSI